MFALVWLMAAAVPQEPGSAGRAEDGFRAGTALRKEGRLDEAIARFRQVVELPEPPPADPELQARFVEARAEAQWELAECLYAKGAHAEALLAYRASRERYPRKSLVVSPCGKVGAVAQYEGFLGEARCLECLGRHDEAVRIYFHLVYGEDFPGLHWGPEVHFRLVDLYESAGQVADLRAILDAKDGAFVKRRVEEGKGRIPRDEAARDAPGRVARRVLELREWEREGRWAALADFAAGGPAKIDGFGPAYWEALEACRLLGRHPDAAVPPLRGRLQGAAASPWICYALGLCGTREAIEGLREVALRDADPARVASLVRALRRAAPAGKAAAEALEREAAGEVKRALQRDDEGRAGGGPTRIAFPPIPEGLRLPARP